VLFQQRFWAGIADGSITLTFRRWKRPQVVAGRPNRTPAGRIHIVSIREIDPSRITARDAKRAGFPDAGAVRDALRGTDDVPTYRIEFEYLDEPDPRAMLASSDALAADDVADIRRRLDRLDRASSHGPWTDQTLELIATQPAVRAPELAAGVGRETQPFKLDVRKLKALGLTMSLKVGYELSPRGRAFRIAEQTPRDQ
jgi:hypothetical protein